MKAKEVFVTLVGIHAIARDLSQGTSDSERILNSAHRIEDQAIPPNITNAAKVFTRHAGGSPNPPRWMKAA